ncbi:MAG: GNAT family N-acetyltransferase [Ignavibacteria bacterium]|nr:GNAT family N-acetyltransferase [Ignavibacteria bacterium]
MIIREMKKEDREQLKEILFNTQNFSIEEKEVGLELIDIALNNPNQKDYYFKVAEENERVLGYYCIGHRALTDGVFDLYWIVVSPDARGLGIGTKLIEDAEEFVKSKNGRLILAETSSRDDYASTREFYKKNNYKEVAIIKDFYRVGDSLIIFGKYINNQGE